MTITVEQYPEDSEYRQKVTIEVNDDATIDEMITAWERMLLALQYHPKSVQEALERN